MQPPPWSSVLYLAAPAVQGGVGPGPDGLGGPPPGAWAPLLLLGLPVLVAIVLLWMYVRTARQHRVAQLAPPVWLLPYLEQQASTAAPAQAPAPDADHLALEEMRLESTARLARRKRALLVGLGLNFVAGWAGAAVYLYAANREVQFAELPPSTTLAATLDTAAFQGLEGPGGLTEDTTATPATEVAPVDTAALRLRREFLARRRDSLAEVARRDSVALAEAVAQRVRDSVAAAIRDSVARAQAAARTVVAPPPAPPPPSPAAPDPAVVRERANAVLQAGAASLVEAINAREGLEGLLGPGREQDQFGRFVAEYRPTATLQDVVELQVVAGSASVTARLRLAWRGAFGDNRSVAGRFRLEAVPAGEGWRMARVVPLQTLP